MADSNSQIGLPAKKHCFVELDGQYKGALEYTRDYCYWLLITPDADVILELCSVQKTEQTHLCHC